MSPASKAAKSKPANNVEAGRQRDRDRRRDLIREQVASGDLTIRKMTAAERRKWGAE